MRLPEDFIIRIKRLLTDEWENLLSSLEHEPPTSIRLNRTKTRKLTANITESIPWCKTGYYLDKRPQFTFDPLFHAGCYYVQEASSMFVEQAIRQYVNNDIRILDLCAAPGGKSTLLAGLISEKSLLVSNEVIRSRANILAENITKWGNPNVIVTNNDPADFSELSDFFDVILVDAPCSGEGMFRKDEGAINEWSVANIGLCKERQQRILANVWNALKPGGLLMYSTCTYNSEENEENVRWLCDEFDATTLPLQVSPEWNIAGSALPGISAYHFYPHRTKGEGFFFSLLRKNGEYASNNKPDKEKSIKKERKRKVKIEDQYKDYHSNNSQLPSYSLGDFRFAFPTGLYNDLTFIKSKLNITNAGICVGEVKGKNFIPNQSLAMSIFLNRKAFTTFDIDRETAISYLRKEALTLSDLPVGYILLTYSDVPLGFVKNIGNRANNLYPNEWRIRSQNTPSEEISVLSPAK